MPVFRYKALQKDGRVIEGEVSAYDRADVLRKIEAQQLRPISIREGSNGKFKGESRINGGQSTSTTGTAKKGFWLFERKRVSRAELENFTRSLANLLAAGVSLSRALVILQRETATPAAREKWKMLHDLVVDGASLAEAMSRFPEVFPKVYIAMVEAGETGGFLEVVLTQISDFMEREKELRTKVISALTYPMILMVLAIGVLIYMLTFFIPRFQNIFAGVGAQLPAITRAVIQVGQAIRDYGLFLLVGLIVVNVAMWNWGRSERGKRVIENVILNLPMLGVLTAQYAMARFCRMLGTLLNAGVPLINALNVARRSIGNQILVDAVERSIELVKEGKPLGVSLAECKRLFPSSVLEMITVAEESGRLEKELIRIADVTEKELDRKLRTAVSLAEPVLLFIMAGLIGLIFISLLLPIFTLQEYINK